MTSAKKKMVELIQDPPDDATYEEILRELAFQRMVDSTGKPPALPGDQESSTVPGVGISHASKTKTRS